MALAPHNSCGTSDMAATPEGSANMPVPTNALTREMVTSGTVDKLEEEGCDDETLAFVLFVSSGTSSKEEDECGNDEAEANKKTPPEVPCASRFFGAERGHEPHDEEKAKPEGGRCKDWRPTLLLVTECDK